MISTRLSSLFICLAVLLGGCSPASRSDSVCIKTAVISSLSEIPLSHFVNGDSRPITLSSFKGGCGGARPELPGGYDDIGMTVTLSVPTAQHPTGKTSEVEVPLFVALLDRHDNVLDRQDDLVKIKVSDNALNQIHKITYRPPGGIDVESINHRILVGFKAIEEAAPSLKVACEPPYKKELHKKKIHKKKPRKKLKKRIAKGKRARQ